MFQDITTLLLDHSAFKDVVDIFVDRYRDMDISVVAGNLLYFSSHFSSLSPYSYFSLTLCLCFCSLGACIPPPFIILSFCVDHN